MTFQSNHERRLLLEQALDEIDRLQDDDVVFARKPWTVASEAIIGKLDHKFLLEKLAVEFVNKSSLGGIVRAGTDPGMVYVAIAWYVAPNLSKKRAG